MGIKELEILLGSMLLSESEVQFRSHAGLTETQMELFGTSSSSFPNLDFISCHWERFEPHANILWMHFLASRLSSHKHIMHIPSQCYTQVSQY